MTPEELQESREAKDADGNAVMKPWYEVTEEDREAILKILHGMPLKWIKKETM